MSKAKSHDVAALGDQIAAAAQSVYDEWVQDEDGNDEELGTGGICDGVAEQVAAILRDRLGVDAMTQYIEMDTHTVTIAAFSDGVFTIDIPARVYEVGCGYTWEKLSGITITADDIAICQLSQNPDDISQFVDHHDDTSNSTNFSF